MRRAALLGGAVLLLAACGQGADGGGGGGETAGPATDLSITVLRDEGAEPVVMELQCDPVGGDHPNPEAACEVLAAADEELFEPVPGDAVCTMIAGGPETASITGTLDGEDLDAEFSRADGCEIARWDALGTEVLDVPMQ